MPETASESLLGPFGDSDSNQPHVYARDVRSAAGACVCKAALGEDIHLAAAPGLPVPDSAREVAKSAEPQRYVLGIAYRAGIDPAIAKGMDGGRDYFEPAELEKAAFSFLSSGPRVGLFHVDGTDENGGAAQVVESYIYRNDQPWDLGDGLVVRKGDWVVGAVLSPRAWDLYKAGKITGWSMQGTAKRRRTAREAS